MPVIGLGTAADPLNANAMKAAVIECMELGYRHFDTGNIYGSEMPFREVIAESIRLCHVRSHQELLFIEWKLRCSDAHADRIVPALKNSLKKRRKKQ